MLSKHSSFCSSSWEYRCDTCLCHGRKTFSRVTAEEGAASSWCRDGVRSKLKRGVCEAGRFD